MKKLIFTLLPLIIFFGSYSQSTEETEIRKLEFDQKEAFLKKDTITLLKLYSPSFVVNSPWNKVSTLQDVMDNIRKGLDDRQSFERIIEKITFVGDIAIVMGQETIKPTGKAPNAGKTVQRRYTNIWMKNKNSWQLIARQSTVFAVE